MSNFSEKSFTGGIVASLWVHKIPAIPFLGMYQRQIVYTQNVHSSDVCGHRRKTTETTHMSIARRVDM